MKLNIVTSLKVGKRACTEVSSCNWDGYRGLLPVPKGSCDNTWQGRGAEEKLGVVGS